MPGNEDADWPQRRRLRLRDYDYSQAGAYAVTICTQGGAFLFGHVSDGTMHLSAAGRVVERVWNRLPEHYPHVELDTFVVMPDHVHGVIVLADAPLCAEEGFEANRRQKAGPDASIGRRGGSARKTCPYARTGAHLGSRARWLGVDRREGARKTGGSETRPYEERRRSTAWVVGGGAGV